MTGICTHAHVQDAKIEDDEHGKMSIRDAITSPIFPSKSVAPSSSSCPRCCSDALSQLPHPPLISLMSLNFRPTNQAIKQATDIIRKRCSSAQAVSARMLSNRSIPSGNADPFPQLPPLTTSSGQTVLPIRMVCLLSVPCFSAFVIAVQQDKAAEVLETGAESGDAG